jgi:hypothetical protein
MTETPEMQAQLVSSHGMLAILEVLEAKPSRDVSLKLLCIINLVSLVRFHSEAFAHRVSACYRRCGLLGKFLPHRVRCLSLRVQFRR